jgi:hypothetical protein
VTKPSIESAFIQKEDLVLDPSLLSKTVLERMPTPSGLENACYPLYREANKQGRHSSNQRNCGPRITCNGCCLCCEERSALLLGQRKVRRNTMVRRRRLGVNWPVCWCSLSSLTTETRCA